MRSFRFTGTVCAIVFGLGISATSFSQQAPVPVAPTLSPSAAPASNTITASHLQVAREVLISSGISRSFEAFIPQFIDQAKANITPSRPELIKDLEDITKIMDAQLGAEKSEILELGAKVYASQLTEAELKDIAAFFKTPSGMKYVSTQPRVLEELFGEMQAWSQRLGARIMDIFRIELKKRGHEL